MRLTYDTEDLPLKRATAPFTRCIYLKVSLLLFHLSFRGKWVYSPTSGTPHLACFITSTVSSFRLPVTLEDSTQVTCLLKLPQKVETQNHNFLLWGSPTPPSFSWRWFVSLKEKIRRLIIYSLDRITCTAVHWNVKYPEHTSVAIPWSWVRALVNTQKACFQLLPERQILADLITLSLKNCCICLIFFWKSPAAFRDPWRPTGSP